MSLVLEELPLRDLLITLLGDDWKRRLVNRGKTNDQLLSEYLDLIAASKSPKWHYETRRLLRDFWDFIGQFPPTMELFTKFFQRYSQLSPSTRARYYYVFSAFFKWYNGQNIPFKIKAPKPQPQLVPDEDIASLRTVIEHKRTHKKLIERDLVLLETLKNVGLRRAELADLKVGELHLSGRTPFLLVRRGKGGKARELPLNKEIAELLAAFTRGKKAEESVFNLSAKSISGKIRQWAIQAGVQVHTHSLRHKFATDILERGGNIRAVQRLLGHESLATTEGYLAVTDQSLRDAVDLLTVQGAGAGSRSKDAGNGQALVTTMELEVALKGLSYDDYMSGPVEHVRYYHEPFFLGTKSDRILIDSIGFRSSAPDVPYRLLLFEKAPPDDSNRWHDADVVAMEEVDRLSYSWALNGPLQYENRDRKKGVFGVLLTGWRSPRFDIEGEELMDYFREPVQFTITLRYTVDVPS